MKWFDLKFIISVIIGLAGLISNFYFHMVDDDNSDNKNNHKD